VQEEKKLQWLKQMLECKVFHQLFSLNSFSCFDTINEICGLVNREETTVRNSVILNLAAVLGVAVFFIPSINPPADAQTKKGYGA
jgi:hypothetical protein